MLLRSWVRRCVTIAVVVDQGPSATNNVKLAIIVNMSIFFAGQ